MPCGVRRVCTREVRGCAAERGPTASGAPRNASAARRRYGSRPAAGRARPGDASGEPRAYSLHVIDVRVATVRASVRGVPHCRSGCPRSTGRGCRIGWRHGIVSLPYRYRSRRDASSVGVGTAAYIFRPCQKIVRLNFQMPYVSRVLPSRKMTAPRCVSVARPGVDAHPPDKNQRRKPSPAARAVLAANITQNDAFAWCARARNTINACERTFTCRRLQHGRREARRGREVRRGGEDETEPAGTVGRVGPLVGIFRGAGSPS